MMEVDGEGRWLGRRVPFAKHQPEKSPAIATSTCYNTRPTEPPETLQLHSDRTPLSEFLTMDASALLKSQGWRGKGFSLHPTDNGIGLAKPILVSRNKENRGIGQKPHYTSDQWWLDAFDQKLKGLDTSGKKGIVQSVTTGKLDVIANCSGNGKYTGTSGLYASFVRGEPLEGTLTPDSVTPSNDGHGGETKEERRARRAARKLEKLEKAARTAAEAKKKRKAAEKAAKKQAKLLVKSIETKEERRARRTERRARKEARRKRREKKAEGG